MALPKLNSLVYGEIGRLEINPFLPGLKLNTILKWDLISILISFFVFGFFEGIQISSMKNYCQHTWRIALALEEYYPITQIPN